MCSQVYPTKIAVKDVRPSFAYTEIVPAESLFEAAVEAMAVSKKGVLAELPLPPGTGFTIRVKAPEEEDTVTVAKVLVARRSRKRSE